MARQGREIGALASYLGKSRQTTSFYLRGIRAMDIDDLAGIAAFLQLEPLELVARATGEVAA